MKCRCCGQTVEGRPCTVCKQWKPLEEFPEQSGGRFGRRAACRGCHKLRRMGALTSALDSHRTVVHRMS